MTVAGPTTTPKSSAARWVVYISVMILGACGLAYEYTISKVAADLLGDSVRQWAIIIGVMMFFMGLGADLQKHLASSKLFDFFIAGEIGLGLAGAFAPVAMLFAFGQFNSHYVLVQYFFVASIGLLIGLEIPLLTRINESYTSELRVNLGSILRMDYMGALLGALAWVFVLPEYFTVIQMAFVLAATTLLTAALALVYFWRRLQHPMLLGGFWSVAMLLVVAGLVNAEDWEVHGLQFLYRDPVVFAAQSKYQHVVVTHSSSQKTSLYINGHLQFSSHDEAIYHENLVHPAMNTAGSRRRVLILGGGDGLAAREVLRYPDVERVTLVDLDPMITDLARQNPWFTKLNQGSLQDARTLVVKNSALIPSGSYQPQIPNRRAVKDRAFSAAEVEILNVDAGAFLRQVHGEYDVVIVDFPDPNSPELSKLYSKWFYTMVRRRMAPEAVMVLQSSSPYYVKEAFLAVGRTLESAGFKALPYHDTVPSFGKWGFWLARPDSGEIRQSMEVQLQALTKLPVATSYLTAEKIRASLVFGKGQLQSEYSDINTLLSGRLHERYRQGWLGKF